MIITPSIYWGLAFYQAGCPELVCYLMWSSYKPRGSTVISALDYTGEQTQGERLYLSKITKFLDGRARVQIKACFFYSLCVTLRSNKCISNACSACSLNGSYLFFLWLTIHLINYHPKFVLKLKEGSHVPFFGIFTDPHLTHQHLLQVERLTCFPPFFSSRPWCICF